jgi:hypothetical protein
MTETTTQTLAIGDRFKHTGDRGKDFLHNAIHAEATGVITGTYGKGPSGGNRWLVTFDAESMIQPYADRGNWFVSESEITKVAPESTDPAAGFKVGDRFTYTGNPLDDSLIFAVSRGDSGEILDTYPADSAGGTRWLVHFDNKKPTSRNWVRESNITSAEPAAETEAPSDPLSLALAERDKAVAELASFKKTVVRVAQEYAEDNDWCSTVDDALHDMGLETESTSTVRVTLFVELPVKHRTARVNEDDVNDAVDALNIPGYDYVDGWRVL